jgi:hypothetical protein
MQLLDAITEDQMMATFLQGELHSERFGAALRQLLHRDQMSPQILQTPDLRNPTENSYRLRLLGAFRGYRQNRDLFERFPSTVVWQRVHLTSSEVLRIKYIDYSYWNDISNGTRLPTEAAKTVRAGRLIFGQLPTDGFVRSAAALKNGARFPELIAVRASTAADIVVLEGHVRLTLYALVPAAIPPNLTLILGTSPDIGQWNAYGRHANEATQG